MPSNIKYIIILSIVLLSSCLRVYKLGNGVTKVPLNNNLFKNKDKFNKELLLIVDTAVLYEEFSTKNNILYRLDNDPLTEFYGNFKFYSGGELNFFVANRNDTLNKNSFNPAFNGYRGIYFYDGYNIVYELFGIASQNGVIGKLKGTLTFNPDYAIENLNG